MRLFFCKEIFSSSEINEWYEELDGNKTATCPFFCVDSVIGETEEFPITKEFLAEMHEYWF